MHCDTLQILTYKAPDFSGVREFDKGISPPIKTILYTPSGITPIAVRLRGKKKVQNLQEVW